ncbi:MAG: hypothetical protein HKP58_20950 [Desulfatitalea sp.]|nr:hypothetical protein [Desulfatitalea sp.]NNK02887.1 hypothetical protein [Desulfatitalea sp.]
MQVKRNAFILGWFVYAVFFFAGADAVRAFQVGDLDIGGAMRVSYTIGDYGPDVGHPSRAEGDGGTFALDTFRINLDYLHGPWAAKVEYRFYPGYAASNHDGYHFLHTGWVGYHFADEAQLQMGVNRVPFGPGPYGVSRSFFFDLHFYVGLSDDMDLGIKYTRHFGELTVDVGYYCADEGTYFGATEDSTRYSYDVVDETGSGYEERHQINVRGIYALGDMDIGASFQYGLLNSNGSQDDGSHFAGSIHAVPKFGDATLALQLTYYSLDVDENQPEGTDKLVTMGAFDFPTLVAARAWIPAASLSYRFDTDAVDWLDYILPYIEYSSIVKDESGFNDSRMLTFGSAWAHGGWFIYTDLVYANGNDFIGNKSGYGTPPGLPYFASNRFGENLTNEWEYRFNINFGYYF